MPQRDVLLEGQETVEAGATFRTSWVPTAGLRQVAMSAHTAYLGGQPYIEESRDGTNAFLSTGTPYQPGGWAHAEFVPGAAFIRLAFPNGTGSAVTLEYSLRGIE